ncbi:MAG: ATP-binding protein [Lachnotalea sp.]
MENITYLDALDQIRYILGMVAAFYVFFINAAPKRKNFTLRVTFGLIGCIFLALSYLFLLGIYKKTGEYGAYAIGGIVYWLAMSFVVISYMVFCYEISWGYALFRAFTAFSLEAFVTTILKYIIVKMWFPNLPETYTIRYITIAIIIYIFCYTLVYRIIAIKIQSNKSADLFNNQKTVTIYILIIILRSLVNDASRGVCEWTIKPIQEYFNMNNLIATIQYYSIGIMLLLSIIILIVQFYVYEISVLQNEQELFNHLLSQRKAQYIHSRENIDIINQKCHDLKHQILALENASGQERKEMIYETKKAVMFYDAVVKTNNEVLNTILTEKTLVCANRNIRLTCMANADHLSVVGVIDLYTILGNALDNAIECMDQLHEEGKKAIAIIINEHGKMLDFSVENYYEKPIRFKAGIPVTSKKDKRNHGIGIQSIRMIAKKYGGDIRISTENQIFSLQIIIPITISKKNG